jgi:phosphoenolpyruvate carboxylase
MIPRLMCTQHPDATVKITSAEEVDEALVAFAAYGCEEVMVDYEGKTTPYSQPKEIVAKCNQAELPLGERYFLTPRMPNPKLEEFERAMLTVEAALIANYFSVKLMGRQAVKWIVLPMVADVDTPHLVYRLLLRKQKIYEEELGTRWEPVEVIPLVEDAFAQLKVEDLLSSLISKMEEKPKHVRLFLGKSDSAVKYGHLASALAIVKLLSSLHRVEDRLGVKIFPILGMGSPPFRGGINNPRLVHMETVQYAGFNTVTVQSAVRYDVSYDEYSFVREVLLNACCLRTLRLDVGGEVDTVITLASSNYRALLSKYAAKVVEVARLVPSTRERVSWTVYGRSVVAHDRVVNMPRAIVYTATWYAMGLPPTLIDAPTIVELAKQDKLDAVLKALPTLKAELTYDAQFYDPATAEKYVGPELVKIVEEALDYLDIKERSSGIYQALLRSPRNESNVLAAGKYRKFLG